MRSAQVLTMAEPQRAWLVAAGREKVRARFTRDAFAARLEALYDALLTTRHASSERPVRRTDRS